METHRLISPPEGSFFLFGARGTGKSTWLRLAFPDASFVDLLDPAELRRMTSRPEHLEERVRGGPDGRTWIVDEVQRAPEVLPVVHRLLEEGRWRFVLTGSSARKLKRTGVDLLAGRAALRTMHPFLAAELGPRFELPAALEIGLVPLVLAAADPRDTLRAYVDLYVHAEVQAEGFVRRAGDFGRFLEAISFSHGQMLNVSEVARESAVGRKTVESYVGVLEDLLLAFRIPPFEKRARRAVVGHPKLYFIDPGIFRALRPSGPLDRPEELQGAAVEGLVAQHLRAWADYGRRDAKLHFFRTRAGSEVDFVVYGADAFTALEVKNAARVHTKDVRGLRAFRQDYPESSVALLHRGPHRLEVEGVPCLPLDPFLRALHPTRSLADALEVG